MVIPPRLVHETRQQFAAAAHAEAAVELFHVDVNGVGASVEVVGDLLFAIAGQQALEGLVHPGGEALHRRAGAAAVRRLGVAVGVVASVRVHRLRGAVAISAGTAGRGVEQLAQVGDELALAGDGVVGRGVAGAHQPGGCREVATAGWAGRPGHGGRCRPRPPPRRSGGDHLNR